jgi:branched-subunit amino acid transport protein
VSEVWLTIGVLAAATALIRAAGPVILGGRELPPRLMGVIALLAPALLAALVLVETVGTEDRTLELDARLLGVAAAGGVLASGRSMLWAVVAAAATAAAARAIAGV